jgi:hypothetical protein
MFEPAGQYKGARVGPIWKLVAQVILSPTPSMISDDKPVSALSLFDRN